MHKLKTAVHEISAVSAAWKIARKIRATPAEILLSIGVTAPPVSVRQIATKLGVAIFYSDILSEDYAGFLEMKGDRPVITVDIQEPEFRQRYVIAHYLAHLVMHPVPKTGSYIENEPTYFREKEANQFAAELLVPLEMLANNMRNCGFHVVALADLFAVSSRLVNMRLVQLREQLGVVTR